MLAINAVTNGPGSLTLDLEGRLAAEEVAELGRAAAACIERGDRVGLDLSDVIYVDGAGLALLRSLVRRQVAMRGVSSFMVRVLDETHP